MPTVHDDFGDVFGVFLAVTGKGYSYREIKDYVDLLRRELLLVPGVAKISLWGAQQEQIFVEVSRTRVAQLGIPLESIYETLGQQNKVADGGDVRVGNEYITINPSGKFDSVDAIGNLLIDDPSGEGRLIYMRDVANISRGYQEPPDNLMRYDGEPEQATAPADHPKLVKTIVLGGAQQGSGISLPGRVDAVDKVELAFQVNGPLIELPILEGQRVKQGDLLARIDPRDYENFLDAAPDLSFPVSLRELATRADPTTQTYRARLIMPSPKEINVLPGMTATFFSSVDAETEDHRFLIPKTALAGLDDNPVVWVVDMDSMTVSKRTVKIEQQTEDGVEVVEGLKNGERIVETGVDLLQESDKVRLYFPDMLGA